MFQIRIGFNADPDLAFHLDAEPDQAFYLTAYPDPESQSNADLFSICRHKKLDFDVKNFQLNCADDLWFSCFAYLPKMWGILNGF
jgi:hypothetical protein